MTRIPILTFHSIDPSGSVISTRPGDFRRLLQRLAAAGWQGRTVSDVLAAARHAADVPRMIGLSFDDAYGNLRTQALPVLRDLGFAATVFVIAGRCGHDNRWPGQPASIPTLDLASWADLEALATAGWEIGSHGMSHLPLTAVDPERAMREVDESKGTLERTLGVPVPLFAYPYGVYTDAVRQRTRAQYDAACGARLALASTDDIAARFDLPRIDAYYLRRFPPIGVDSAPGRGYLALRRWARRLRRQPHWDPTATAAAG